MSSRARGRGVSSSLPPASPTYGRDEDGLWDDDELIELWNEQLERMKKQEIVAGARSVTATASPVDLAYDSPAEGSVDKDAGTDVTITSARSTSTESNAPQSGLTRLPQPQPEAHTVQHGVLSTGALSSDVATLVQSFYNAGYEAGLYVGRQQSATAAEAAKRRKRRRSSS